MFFVISGFLISTIIFKHYDDNSFSFSDFYSRRIRRIFPALILVLSFCLSFGQFALLPDEYKLLGKHTVSGAGFVENYLLWKEAGYFDMVSSLKPLMHLWSLSIEEQFYLLYPLITFVFWRKRLNLFTLITSVAIVSFAYNQYSINTGHSVAAFFMPHMRFWEIMVGSALAYRCFDTSNIATLRQDFGRTYLTKHSLWKTLLLKIVSKSEDPGTLRASLLLLGLASCYSHCHFSP